MIMDFCAKNMDFSVEAEAIEKIFTFGG